MCGPVELGVTEVDVDVLEVEVTGLVEVLEVVGFVDVLEVEVTGFVEVLEVVAFVETTDEVLVTFVLDDDFVVAEVTVVYGGRITLLLKSYTSNRLGPPQNSERLPLHKLLHPKRPSGASFPPFWIVLSQ